MAAGAWFWRYGSQCEDPISNYQIALMWSLTTLTTVGYGDVCPHEDSPGELVVAIIAMLIGSMFFSVVITNITELTSKFDAAQRNVKERMQEVNAFVRSSHMPPALQRALSGFFSFKMGSGIVFGDEAMMAKLSPPLRHAVLRHPPECLDDGGNVRRP